MLTSRLNLLLWLQQGSTGLLLGQLGVPSERATLRDERQRQCTGNPYESIRQAMAEVLYSSIDLD